MRYMIAATASITSICLLLWEQSAMAESFHLQLNGDEQTVYTGVCTVRTASGTKTVILEGRVPHERVIAGETLSCRMETTDLLVVNVRHGGNSNRSVTDGGVIILNLH